MPAEHPPTQTPVRDSHAWQGLNRALGPIDTFGAILTFAGRAIAGIPRSLRYAREIWWYAAFLAVGSTPVALVITYISGSECSVEGYYSLAQLGGAQSLVGIFKPSSDTPDLTPLFLCFASAA